MRLSDKRLEAKLIITEGYLWLRLVRRKAFWRAANSMPAKIPPPVVPCWIICILT